MISKSIMEYSLEELSNSFDDFDDFEFETDLGEKSSSTPKSVQEESPTFIGLVQANTKEIQMLTDHPVKQEVMFHAPHQRQIEFVVKRGGKEYYSPEPIARKVSDEPYTRKYEFYPSKLIKASKEEDFINSITVRAGNYNVLITNQGNSMTFKSVYGNDIEQIDETDRNDIRELVEKTGRLKLKIIDQNNLNEFIKEFAWIKFNKVYINEDHLLPLARAGMLDQVDTLVLVKNNGSDLCDHDQIIVHLSKKKLQRLSWKFEPNFRDVDNLCKYMIDTVTLGIEVSFRNKEMKLCLTPEHYLSFIIKHKPEGKITPFLSIIDKLISHVENFCCMMIMDRYNIYPKLINLNLEHDEEILRKLRKMVFIDKYKYHADFHLFFCNLHVKSSRSMYPRPAKK